MQNLEPILALAGTALSLLVACVTFIVKFIRSVRARLKEKGLTALLEAVPSFVGLAETIANYTGKEKKEFVLTKVNQYALENGITKQGASKA